MVTPTLLIFPKHLWYWSAPPPGIGYIASSLEAIGCRVKLIDCQITPRYKEKILSALPDYPVVGLSVNAGNVSSALDIARAIRKQSPKTKIIMGGPHATAVYDILIPEYADIVVRGEGEATVTELFQTEDLSKVKGIAYWEGELKTTPPRPYIEDLDALRFPAWHLYELKKYALGNTSRPLAIIITSRGCPYDCIYCVKFVHGYKVRLRSVDNVLSEIDYLVTHIGIREIQIMDDVFTLYPERVKEFCNRIIERKYRDLKFDLGGGIRADSGDQEMFDLLVKAGCYMVAISIESGSQIILDKINKKLTLDAARRTVAMAHNAGMQVHLIFVLGFPFENLETMRETVKVARDMPAEQTHFFVATPFPGTKFYDIVKEKGKFLCDLNVTSIDFNGKPVYETDYLKVNDLENIFGHIYRDSHFKPRQIFRKTVISFAIRYIKIFFNSIK